MILLQGSDREPDNKYGSCCAGSTAKSPKFVSCIGQINNYNLKFSLSLSLSKPLPQFTIISTHIGNKINIFIGVFICSDARIFKKNFFWIFNQKKYHVTQPVYVFKLL